MYYARQREPREEEGSVEGKTERGMQRFQEERRGSNGIRDWAEKRKWNEEKKDTRTER